VQRDGTPSTNWQNAQVRISGKTDTNMQLNLGYDTTNNLGVIQAGQATVAFKNLLLNPFGGNIGIGSITAPTHKLEVNGSVAGVGPYQDISDRRYKTNITPLDNALERVMRLRGVSFDWRQAEFPDLNFNKGRQVGFIAQEVERVLPEVVFKDERGMYTMAYSSVVPLLVEAIKQQQRSAEEKDQRVTRLINENVALRERLSTLERAVEKLTKN
jgi:hypothetical protein